MISLTDDRMLARDESRRTADVALRGTLTGEWNWLTPRSLSAAHGRVSLRSRPAPDAAQVTEALLGEPIELLEELPGGWAWVRTVHDGYLGYTRTDALGEPVAGDVVSVRALRGHLFAAPKVSATILGELALGARLARLDGHAYEDNGRTWARVAYGGGEAYVQTTLISENAVSPGAVSVGSGDAADRVDLGLARRLLDVPYVWGGRSAWGIDCSGLSQIIHPHGALPRDADQQQEFLPVVTTPRAGDLAFFPGHVGVMLGEREMLHANATHMRVTVEVLGEGEYGRRLADELEGFGRWDGTFFRPQDRADVGA